LNFSISGTCNNNGSIRLSDFVGSASNNYQYSAGTHITENSALNASSWGPIVGGNIGSVIIGSSGTYWVAVRETENPSNIIAKSATINCVAGLGLVLHYDPSNTTSYSGTGTTITGGKKTTTITPGTSGSYTPIPATPATVPTLGGGQIRDLTPQLTKATPFQFASEPDYSIATNQMPAQAPYDYSNQIANAATGGAITDLKPQLTQRRAFEFASNPTYTIATTPIQQPQPHVDYTQQILNAAQGGLIQGYAGGGEFEAPEFPFRHMSPQVARGRRVGALNMFDSYQPKNYFAEGGDVQEHNPEFFSEGGLNSLKNSYVKGKGDGTSDSIPAMLANGEFVIPADVVSSLGNGSNDSGAEILSEFLKTIREHKRKADSKKLPPDSKGALGYLTEAKKKVKK